MFVSKNTYDTAAFLWGGGEIRLVMSFIVFLLLLQKLKTPGNSLTFILKMNYKLFAGNIYHTLFTAQDAEDRCYADSFAEHEMD